MIPYLILKELILSGVRFSYESYDHKKAVEELQQLIHNKSSIHYDANTFFGLPTDCWSIPDEIKKNHIVWRVGKLRQVTFDKEGKMVRFKIGNRYCKSFYLDDFGISVKPRIFKSDDKYNLISQGLAEEETQI